MTQLPHLNVGDLWLWLESVMRRHGPETRVAVVLPSGVVLPCRDATLVEQDGVGAPVVVLHVRRLETASDMDFAGPERGGA